MPNDDMDVADAATAGAVFSMQWTWRLALVLLLAIGALAAITAGLELSGAVARGAILGQAADAERWVALAFGVLTMPVAITALRHANLRIDEVGLHHLGFGLICRTRTIRFAEVRRWGHATTSNRGRREPHLLFELDDGSERSVKLAMYQGQSRILEELRQRLGAPAAVSATIAGVRFDQPV